MVIYHGAYFHQLSGSISNKSSFRQKHPGVPDSSGGSNGTSYALTALTEPRTL
jgi:hypothetical protein